MSVPPQDPHQPHQPQDPHQNPQPYPQQGQQGPGPQGGQGQGQQGPGPQGGQWQGGQWQGGHAAPGGPPPGAQQSALDAKNFFSALFDWRFHTFITPKIVSIVYLVGMVLIAFAWLSALVSGFRLDPLLGVAVLIIGPIGAVVYLAFWRMTLEFYFAVVRMSDDIHRSSGAPGR